MDEQVPRVVIGMDPHKRSVTIEVMLADESVVGGGRFDTTAEGCQAMLAFVVAWPDRVWAIEGCEGIGGHIAHRLLADGQDVVDVPAKLSARARVFATGQGRKTDATDAHSVALVGTRMAGLRPVVSDAQLEVLQLLVDRRRSIGEEHTRKISQLHRILLEMLPGGAKQYLSAAQARALLTAIRPRDMVGKTRKRVAAELVTDLERIYTRKKAADKELKELVSATGTSLLRLHGSALRARRGCWSRSVTCPVSRTVTTSPPGPEPLRSTRPAASTSGTGSPAAGTDRSTGCCTSWPADNTSSYAPRPRGGPTLTARRLPEDVDGSDALPHWVSMRAQVRLTCSSGTARDGLDVSPLDGLFELVALVVAGTT